MRPPATVLFIFAGLALFAIAVLALRPAARGPDVVDIGSAEMTGTAAPTAGPVREETAGKQERLDDVTPTGEGGEIRRVAPKIGIVPPLLPRELERVDARPPLSRTAEPEKPELTKLFRPVATAAGRLEAGGHAIIIAGIEPVDPERTCKSTEGSTWPCGMRARTAFRAWLRGRAVDCRLGDAADELPITAPCSLNGEDIGRWLVDNGWAPSTETGPYADAGKAARKAGKGIFGSGPGAP